MNYATTSAYTVGCNFKRNTGNTSSYGRYLVSTLALALVFALVSTLLTFISSPNTFAYSASISTSSSLVTNIKPKTDGTTSTSITTDNINVITDCKAGYNLTISTSTSDNNLYKNGDNTNNTENQYFSPVDGTSTLINSPNKWGYSLTASTESGVFTPLPTTPTLIKTPATTASTDDINDTFPIYYGVAASNTLEPGVYRMTGSGTIVYQLTLDNSCSGGKIIYDDNGANSSTTMSNQVLTDDDITNNTVTLWASNFQRPGYGFAGWNTKADGTGTNYGPNETITDATVISNIEDNNLTLYANWIPAETDANNNLIYFQNWTGCNAMNIGDVTALTDKRDNDTYAVAKLADGNCWMIENLRLDNTPELSSANTNNPYLPLNNSWWFSTDNDSDTIPTSNHLSASITPSTTAWCKTNSSNCDDQSMLNTNNTANPVANMTSNSTSTAVYSYGNYYNWYSATAGNGTYSKSSGNTVGDLCPTGWHLPYGYTSGGYGKFVDLDKALGGNGEAANASTDPTAIEMSYAWRKYPNNFMYSGRVFESSVVYRSNAGYYWSATS